jgi:hypothetical protein
MLIISAFSIVMVKILEGYAAQCCSSESLMPNAHLLPLPRFPLFMRTRTVHVSILRFWEEGRREKVNRPSSCFWPCARAPLLGSTATGYSRTLRFVHEVFQQIRTMDEYLSRGCSPPMGVEPCRGPACLAKVSPFTCKELLPCRPSPVPATNAAWDKSEDIGLNGKACGSGVVRQSCQGSSNLSTVVQGA